MRSYVKLVKASPLPAKTGFWETVLTPQFEIIFSTLYQTPDV